jgi:hypothetical protein
LARPAADQRNDGGKQDELDTSQMHDTTFYAKAGAGSQFQFDEPGNF